MTVENQIPYQSYTANGSQTDFALSFYVEDKANFIVKQNGVVIATNDYSYNSLTNTLKFNVAPSTGVIVEVTRATSADRATTYATYNNTFRPEVLNYDLDRIWRKLQEVGVLNWLVNNDVKSLNDYVNSLNEETRVQFFNMIEQQGISLTQLDQYVNNLYTRIAGISVENNWLAEFVADSSGKTQQELNTSLAKSLVFTSNYNLLNSTTIDQSVLLQAAANEAKAKNATLIINAFSDATTYVVHNIDISGIKVEVQNGVTFLPPSTANTGYTFVAIGTQTNRIVKPTILKNAVLDGANKIQGIFKASYADMPQAISCKAINIPTGVNPDGSGVAFGECINPLVERGYYHGGRQGVLFVSCTRPIARNVKVEHQGRDGILFYTLPTGTTTTDALADNCISNDYCINGEGGRAGIHFYGVRRATAIAPQCSEDNDCTIDDTGAVRFRDCEDYFTNGYIVKKAITGVLVNEVGDYAGSPHNIVVRGNIGQGTVENIREYGVAIATPNRSCNVVGAVVKTISSTKPSGAGIYHVGIGTVANCDVQDTLLAGINVSGNVSVRGNVLKNTGKGFNSTPQLRLAGTSSASGNVFSDDRTSNQGTLAIRVSSGNATIGENSYGTGITDFVQIDAAATLNRDSAPIRQKFSGVPVIAGTVQNGCRAVDNNGVYYTYLTSAWKRIDMRKVSGTIGTTQTTVAHGLGYTPTIVNISQKSNASVWQSAVADATNIYLTASVSVNVDIYVQ